MDGVFEYVDQVGLWHVDHSSSFVVVVDALGGTDAATFCALSTLQEQIRAEQTVDVYQVKRQSDKKNVDHSLQTYLLRLCISIQGWDT